MKLRYVLAGSAHGYRPLPAARHDSERQPGEAGDRLLDRRSARRAWARDRDYFTAAAKELGADVIVTSADANEQNRSTRSRT